MKRTTGEYLTQTVGGEPYRAYVPATLPPQPPLELDAALLRQMDEANRALGRLDGISQLWPEPAHFLHQLLYQYVRKEAVLSSQIEGTQSSLSDLLLYELEEAPGVPLDDVQEVSCYVSALNLGIQRIREEHPLTFRLVTELHQALMTSGRGTNRCPGEFRKSQVWIGGHRPDEATFVPAPANEIADCWAELERFINDVPDSTDPLIKAALSHVQFETIHPFMDGNGRIGRLLIPMILVEAGVIKEPLLYLSVFFKKHRQTYYERLNQVRLTGDWEAWLLFFVDAVAETATQAVDTAQQLNELRQKDKASITKLGRQSGSAGQVIDALFEQPVVNINKLIELTGLTAATLGKVLEALEQQLGIVKEVTGQKRNRVYAYTAYIEILNQE